MQIVIALDENLYEAVINGLDGSELYDLRLAVVSGTKLPKGHGDLIDVNRKITVPIYDEQYEEWGEKILTVREALNRWSDEGVTVQDVVILADKERRNE